MSFGASGSGLFRILEEVGGTVLGWLVVVLDRILESGRLCLGRACWNSEDGSVVFREGLCAIRMVMLNKILETFWG